FRYAFDGALSRTADQPGDGWFVQGTLGYDKDFWSLDVTANNYTVHYLPALGLLPNDLPDTRGVAPTIGYTRDLGSGPVREITAYATESMRNTGDGRLQRRYGNVGGTIELKQEV